MMRDMHIDLIINLIDKAIEDNEKTIRLIAIIATVTVSAILINNTRSEENTGRNEDSKFNFD